MGVRLPGRRLLCTKGMERRFKLLVTSCVFLWEWVPREEDFKLSKKKKKKEEEEKGGFPEPPPAGLNICFGGQSSRGEPPVNPAQRGGRRKKSKGGPGTRFNVKKQGSFLG